MTDFAMEAIVDEVNRPTYLRILFSYLVLRRTAVSQRCSLIWEDTPYFCYQEPICFVDHNKTKGHAHLRKRILSPERVCRFLSSDIAK